MYSMLLGVACLLEGHAVIASSSSLPPIYSLIWTDYKLFYILRRKVNFHPFLTDTFFLEVAFTSGLRSFDKYPYRY